jgi:predicted RNA binding protein YcfA (HicA-like mRNA interferase family)
LSYWPSSKAKKVFSALKSIGWSIKPGSQKGSSHVQLVHAMLPEYTWAFDDSDELGPKMIARIAKKTGLKREDL